MKFMENRLKPIAAICVMGLASAANAASVDLGSIGSGDFVGDSLIYDAGIGFDDVWSFTLTDDLTTAISIDANDFAPAFEISDFLVVSDDITFVFDAADNAYSSSSALAAGEYTFSVSGLVTGDFGGSYNVLVGAVPVPAAVWLFGSALLGLAATGRRKVAA